MFSDDTSCSDCKLEIIQKRWTELLLNWLNKCVHPQEPVDQLNAKSLVEVINKYKKDICMDDMDNALLSGEDIEPFIKYRYPILRLKYFWEIKDLPKKMYLMNTIMLFHCCVSSIDGMVDSDICHYLTKHEQEMILKFCERLSDMEVTANNIQCAIKEACDSVTPRPRPKKKPKPDSPTLKVKIQVTKSEPASSVSSKRSVTSIVSESPDELPADSMKRKFNALKFKSSVTVLPSVATDISVHSDAESKASNEKDSSKSDTTAEKEPFEVNAVQLNVGRITTTSPKTDSDSERRCKENCACSRCSPNGLCCADPDSAVKCDEEDEDEDEDEDKGVLSFLREQVEDSMVVWKYWNPSFIEVGKKWISGTREKVQESVVDWSSSMMKLGKKWINRYFWFRSKRFRWTIYLVSGALITLLIIIALLLVFIPWNKNDSAKKTTDLKIEKFRSKDNEANRIFQLNAYICKNHLCEKIYVATTEKIYPSLSRCVLLCMGPQLWPYPIGYTFFSKKIVTLATNRLEYKFQSVPSEAVHQYLAEAFKLFLGDLAKLERYTMEARKENLTRDMLIKKMYIQIDVESDPDPRIRLDTEESYTLKVETANHQVTIKLLAASFCGLRHALETLSQLILLDQTTGYLITLSYIVIKDAPSYKYRGLMIDTGRNYIPVPDIMRTIDAMATCKLNTFHWRISDVTSFPLLLPAVPQLFEYGAYSRSLVYTKEDVKSVVKRAGIRGIRVLLEVSAPGPVGRAWSWVPEATCPTKNRNFTCSNVLCLRLGIRDSIFDILQIIYTEILEMTRVEDVFHLSDSVFSLANCFYLIEEREGFLDKALERLKVANKGFLPKLPIIWYTTHLTKDFEARTWDRFGVQLTEWQPNPSDQFLSRFKVIHSSRWDLSCEVKKQRCRKYRTWQDMYSWKSWRNIEVFTIEGGEAILWTDLVDTGNLDVHLWPRAAAVAERLWSDIALNGSVSSTVYVRLDSHRWRMVLKSVQVQPIWPLYCSFSPGACLEQIKSNKS